MPPAIPRATYRVQLSGRFGFVDAAGIVPYLAELGVSHLYTSPILKARPGSTHGYDIVDHDVLNPELGGDAGFDVLRDALEKADMGLVVDIVPNHMGVNHADNAWWMDVLEWGPRSPHAVSFDIEWDTLPYRTSGGVLLPILGKPYGATLESGELELRYARDQGTFAIWYHDHRLPVRPERYGDIIRAVVEAAGDEASDTGRALLALAKRYRGPRAPSRADAHALRAALLGVAGAVETIERGLCAYRPGPEDPTRITRLHRLLERQHYRLADWRIGSTDINYRRFFDVDDLAGVRVEDPRTFAATHARIAQLIEEGAIHGLRIDHIDGLADPAQYVRRLRRLVRSRRGRRRGTPLYIVVEKILGDGEPMPPLAGAAGATGYEALDIIQRVLIHDPGRKALEAFYAGEIDPGASFGATAMACKALIVDTVLASEFVVLVRLLTRIAAGHWPTRDFTFERLRQALRRVVLNFPVYRTYVGRAASEQDRRTIGSAVSAARAEWPDPDVEIFDFIADVATLDLVAPGRSGYSRARVVHFVTKFQQFTGPVMAKAVEDTAFYRHHALLALDEVGSGPDRPTASAAEFHAAMAARMTHPHTMTATSTHDTKRGEDARMRLVALCETTDEWIAAVRRWNDLSSDLVTNGSVRAPSEPHRYMIYQAMLGAWPGTSDSPDFAERITTFAIKALREGKQETSWAMPDENYENATRSFLAALLDPVRSREFLDDFAAFAERVDRIAVFKSLVQLALKMTMPGVPDLYQGSETWNHALVDPDNRRPVDFAALAAAAREVRDGDLEARILADPAKMKFEFTRALFRRRAERSAFYTKGGYLPLDVSGADAQRVVAFARTLDRRAEIVIVASRFEMLRDDARRPDARRLDATVDLGRHSIGGPFLGFRAGAGTRSGHVTAADAFGLLPVAIASARVAS